MMKLKELIPTSEQLKFVQGIEKNLLERKRKGVILSGIVSVAGGLLQVLISTTGNRNLSDIADGIGGFAKCVYYIFAGQWDKLKGYHPSYELAGIFILGIGLLIYVLLKRTRLLLKESEEPFRYTFWVEPFERIKREDKPFEMIESDDGFHENDERLKRLLHHDLMERLNGRIRRLSLLDESKLVSSPAGKDAESSGKDVLNSHIHINGYYTLRKERDGENIIQVMPQIRIGPSGTPATLASPIKCTVDKGKEENKFKLETETYYKIVERVYSSVATEAYRRIQSDIKEKIKLFPTSYLRAVALFYEAEDFARSNTVDAYDQAIELYKEALRYFDLTEVKTISRALMMCPILWGMEVRFQHMKGRVQIGHAKCLIYRRQISALSGRYRNPLFDIRRELKEVVYNLLLLHNRINSKWPVVISKEELSDENERQETKEELPGENKQEKIKRNNRLNTSLAFLTSPKDSWLRNLLWRANQSLFEIQNCLLFDGYLVSALTHYYLNAVQKAKELLDDAKAVNPQLSERNALYLLTAGTIEPETEKALPLFRQATEVAPDFQIAQYSLAYNSEIRFRMQNEVEKGRAKSVIKEYDRVLEINPGNIAALAAQGYLYWLIYWLIEDIEERKKAKQKLNAGRDVKAMVSQTFIGELNYGLARIAAEEGDFNTSYDRYTEAILADQGVGAYSASLTVTSYFD